MAMFEQTDASSASPVIGFAADVFPIFGGFIDDWEYVPESGDRDACNGMEQCGFYGYVVTDTYSTSWHALLESLTRLSTNAGADCRIRCC